MTTCHRFGREVRPANVSSIILRFQHMTLLFLALHNLETNFQQNPVKEIRFLLLDRSIIGAMKSYSQTVTERLFPLLDRSFMSSIVGSPVTPRSHRSGFLFFTSTQTGIAHSSRVVAQNAAKL
jgi:hypothetical protein